MAAYQQEKHLLVLQLQELEKAIKSDRSESTAKQTMRIKQLEDELSKRDADHDAQMEVQKKDLHLLLRQVIELKKRIGEYDSSGPAANSEIAVLKRELLDRKSELDAAKKTIKALQEDLLATQQDKEKQLVDASQGLADFANQREKSNIYLRTRVNDLQQKLHIVESDLEIERQDKTELDAKCRRLEK